MAEKTVLVIDDEPGIVQVIKLHLERKGYKVFSAHDGEEGLRLAHELKPGLILLDINMPKKGGLEFYNDIVVNNNQKLFPVLVLTSRVEFESFFKDVKADGFVPKPIDFARLVQEVDRIFSSSGAEPKKKGAGKNILIVETKDEALDRFAGAFLRGGFTVHCIKTMQELPDQMPAEPLDLVLINLMLCDMISSLKKTPGLMKSDTILMLYTATQSGLDTEVVKKLCEKAGIHSNELVWTDNAPDLLKKVKEALTHETPPVS